MNHMYDLFFNAPNIMHQKLFLLGNGIISPCSDFLAFLFIASPFFSGGCVTSCGCKSLDHDRISNLPVGDAPSNSLGFSSSEEGFNIRSPPCRPIIAVKPTTAAIYITCKFMNLIYEFWQVS